MPQQLQVCWQGGEPRPVLGTSSAPGPGSRHRFCTQGLQSGSATDPQTDSGASDGYLSPLDSHGLWEAFRASGYRAVPDFSYPDLEMDLPTLRQDLLALPVEDVEHQEVKALLWEKQRELDRQIELVELRGTSGFLPASIDLWGDAEMDLLECAHDLLAALPVATSSQKRARCQEVCIEAERQIEEYQRRDPEFASRVHVVKDLSAKLMVSKGDLHVAADIDVPADQVPP